MSKGAPPALEGLTAALVDAAPDALLVSDRAGAIVLVNARAEALFGYAREELLGKPVETLLPGRPAARVPRRSPRSGRAPRDRATGGALSLSARRKDGTELPVEVSLSPISTEQGTMTAAAVRDVSVRRRTEESLRDAEERFRLALDQAPIGMAIVGVDGRFLRVNPALCEIVGYSPEELTGLTFQHITHPEDVGTDLAHVAKLTRGEIRRYQLGKRYIRKDGAIVHVSVTVSVVRAPDGRALYYIAQIEDATERMLVEAALRSSEAQLRDLFEQASEGIVIADLDGRFRDVNPAYCAMLGFTREELLAKQIVDVVPEEDRAAFAVHHERLFVRGVVEVGEWRVRRKDGVLVPVEVTAKILTGGRWQGFVRDISGRKAEEAARRRLLEAQREQARFLNAIVENIPAMIFLKDATELRFERVNRAAEQLLGWPREAMLGKSDYDFFSKAQADFFQARDRETLRTGKLVDIAEEPIGTRAGERWLRTMKIPLLDDAGTPTHLLGISVDITARKEAEHARDATMHWLRAVLDQSPIGMILAEGKVGDPVTLNDAARRLLGGEGTVFLPYEGFVCMPDGAPVPRDQTPLQQALRGKSIESTEFFIRRQNGELLPVIIGSSPVRGTEGKIIGAVAVAYDATAMKELERLRGEWNSVVAHDLRQPLSTILLQIRLLAAKNENVAELSAPVERINRAVMRLDRMIGDLMDLSRLEARRLTLARERVDLPALTRACLDEIAPRTGDRSFDLQLRGEVPPIEADPVRVSQILHNLLSNAVKYGSSGTPVVVTIEAEDRQVSVAISNEGRGIPPEEIPRLFQRFRRTEDAKLAGIEGIGLGLFITRSLVEAHGGRIEVRSTASGTTTFRFTLPVASAPPSP